MNRPTVPSFPLVDVIVNDDGSAHLNVAGKHVDYSPALLDETRDKIIRDVAAIATELGRGVQMHSTDPDGSWRLVVFPDGEVQDLEPDELGERPSLAPPLPTVVLERRVASRTVLPTAPPIDDLTVLAVPAAIEQEQAPPSAVVATLTFSTGATVTVGRRAMIGRATAPRLLEDGQQQVILHSDERTVSRFHCEIGWDAGTLVVVDRASGNGTHVTPAEFIADAPFTEHTHTLTADEPFELHDGDQVVIGVDVTCTISIPTEGGTR